VVETTLQSLISGLAAPAALFAVAYFTTLAAIPAVRRVATHRKLLDYPDGTRRGHSRPVPRLGGVAIFVGLLIAFLASLVVSSGFGRAAPSVPALAPALVLGGAILFVIGLLDDLRGVPPVLKLLGQTGAALIVYYSGLQVQVISLPPNIELSLGVLSLPITILWLVGVSNAFNLIDGLDGLAGGVALIALLSAAGSGLILGTNQTTPLFAIALAGAMIAFLRYNAPPARIFLGDSGSLVVGFLLAVFTVRGATRHDEVVYAVVPIFALAYLLLDTGIAILRRWLRGSPLSRADGRHIHHQLSALLGPRRAVGVIYLNAFVIAGVGLCATFAPPAMTVAIAGFGMAVLLFIMVYGVRWLEYHEFLEAGASVASAARKARTVIQDKIGARDVARAIENAPSLEQVELILQESAPIFRFAHMRLGRSRRELPEHVVLGVLTSRLWRLEYPVAPELDASVPGFNAAVDPLTLCIWSHVNAGRRPAGAERVAQIIAPAVGRWISANRLERVLDLRPSQQPALADVRVHAEGATRPVTRRPTLGLGGEASPS
jgi:UDP-GlcNAc:undecaprenyl-phosphate GlcNAc-1-phosphate transferase